ncbi:MAG: DUF6057 family protein [Phycisphaerae bacterium]
MLPVIVLLIAMLVFFHDSFDTRLAYQHQSLEKPVFALCLREFTRFVSAPGDAGDWLSQALSQAYYFEWLGPLVIVTMIGTIIAAVVGYVRAVARKGVMGAWVIPAFALMALHNQYDYYMISTLGLLAALAALNAYVWLPVRQTTLRAAALAVLSAALYFLSGPPCALLAVGAAIYEFLTARRWFLGVLCLLIPPAVAFGWEFAVVNEYWRMAESGWSVFGQYIIAAIPCMVLIVGAAVQESLTASLPIRGRLWWAVNVACLAIPAIVLLDVVVYVQHPVWRVIGGRCSLAFWKYGNTPMSWTLIGLYGYVVACGAGVGLWRLLKDAVQSGCPATRGPIVLQPANAAAPGSVAFPFFRIAVVPCILAVAVLAASRAVGPVTLNTELKDAVLLESYYANQQWDRILDAARKTPKDRYSFSINLAVNLALYHKGRLAYDMFTYPQEYQQVSGIFDVPEWTSMCAVSDVFLELGRVNEAEAFAGVSNQADLVQRLAWIKLIKGQPGAARIFLNVLADNVKHRDWARRCLRLLDSGRYAQIGGAGQVREAGAGPAADGDAAREELAAEIARIRGLMTPPGGRDDIALIYLNNLKNNPVVYLAPLIANPRNRFAFEYLMAFYLTQGKLAEFADSMEDRPAMPATDRRPARPPRQSRLSMEYLFYGKPFSYPDIPRSYEEALLVYRHFARRTPMVPGKFIRPETIERYNKFDPLMKKYQELRQEDDAAGKRGDKGRQQELAKEMERQRAVMQKDYWDTFYFYYFVGGGGRP